MVNEQNIRLIFGLKLRKLRQERGLKPKILAQKAGISISYLNEIEKGKKYPKAEKIISLATVLEVEYDYLVSLKLSKNLAPVGMLLKSNFLRDLPLNTFGISLEHVVEIISNAPAKVSAFISTLIEIARNYEMQVEQFYFSALRSYQEMHDNYFEDIEKTVKRFVKVYDLGVTPPINIEDLYRILQEEYHYEIEEKLLGSYTELKSLRSIVVQQNDKNKLLINDNLNTAQKAFQLGKELGYQFMGMEERTITASWMRTKSFDQILNNFRASYFSGALLINRQHLIKDLKKLFNARSWNGDHFLSIMHSYNVSPETFMHRLTNILPRFFGLNQLFFLRFTTKKGSEAYEITKELHLSNRHNPQGNSLNEHYCRRWITINVLKELEKLQLAGKKDGAIVRVQRSKYIDSDREYFCISVARAMYPTPDTNSSVTIGLLVNKDFRSRVKFSEDLNIPVRMVNNTCERCRLSDCGERVALPSVLHKQNKRNHLESLVEEVIEQAKGKGK